MTTRNRIAILSAILAAVIVTAQPARAVPVTVDTANPANGLTDLFSATFDGALSPCSPSDPSWCTFFNGKPGPNRNIVITPNPTGVVNAMPLGITPVPNSGSYLDLTLNGPRTQVTLSGGTITLPVISLTIQGGTPNATVVNVGGAGVVFSSTPQVAALDANGRAEFLVSLAPSIAVDFSTFGVIAGAPNGSCSGPLCSIIPILTLDMVRYRLVIDYNEDFTTFTAGFIGQTGNNSILSITMNSEVPQSSGIRVRLDAHNQRSSSGVLSTLKWSGCTTISAMTPCLSTSTVSTGGIWANANATPSNAVWTWDAATGILSMTGTFQTTVFISSNANGSPVISDKVVNMVIDTTNDTTTADSYRCVEGTFLASVGANGCLNTSLGGDFDNDSSALYDVGGNALCVQRTVGGDDESMGNTRGVTTVAAAPLCDATDGAFDLWNVEVDNTATPGGQLIVRNSVTIDQAGTNYLTFTAVADAADDGPFNAQATVPLTLDVLANDTSFTDPVAVSIATPPTKGTAVVTGSPGNRADIRIEYTADAGALGPDSFVYTVLDADGLTSDTATVNIDVLAGIAVDDNATTVLDQPVEIDVLDNDNGLAPTVFVGIWTDPLHGTAEVSGAPGAPSGIRVTYTPSPGYSGPDSFEYWVESGLDVDYAVVSITVTNPDSDGDGVLNGVDNCAQVANPAQCDSDGDGYGNHCDGDLTNNGFTNSQDSVVLRARLGAASGAPTYNAADLNCNGFVNAQDTVLFRQLLGKSPGPSGLVP